MCKITEIASCPESLLLIRLYNLHSSEKNKTFFSLNYFYLFTLV